MSEPICDSARTSNDLPGNSIAINALPSLNYRIIAQSAEVVQDIQNAPAISMAPYLIESGQTQLLNTISVYSLRGESREQVRLLYMNGTAFDVWEKMGKLPTIIGRRFRPPHAALLVFGVPFSE